MAVILDCNLDRRALPGLAISSHHQASNLGQEAHARQIRHPEKLSWVALPAGRLPLYTHMGRTELQHGYARKCIPLFRLDIPRKTPSKATLRSHWRNIISGSPWIRTLEEVASDIRCNCGQFLHAYFRRFTLFHREWWLILDCIWVLWTILFCKPWHLCMAICIVDWCTSTRWPKLVQPP